MYGGVVDGVTLWRYPVVVTLWRGCGMVSWAKEVRGRGMADTGSWRFPWRLARTQARSRRWSLRRHTCECAQLQGSYPVARLEGGYFSSRATQRYSETATQAAASRSTQQAPRESPKRPFRVLQICQSKSENAESGSGRLGASGRSSTGASQGGESVAVALVPLASLLAKPRAVIYRGYPVATL